MVAGWQLAEWIVDGEPTIDMLGVEPRRYGDYCSKSYLKKKMKKLIEMYLLFIILMKKEAQQDL